MTVRSRRGSLISVLIGVLCLVMIGTPSAAADAVGARTHVVTKKVTLHPDALASSQFTAARAQPVGANSDEFDVPPPQCLPDAGFLTKMWYTNGILQLTSTDFFGEIECLQIDHFNQHETMAHLSAFTQLAINTVAVDEGPLSECTHNDVNDSACWLAFSADNNICAGQINCAGRYQVLLPIVMSLPQGWIWTSWPEDVCTRVLSSELSCIYYTNVVIVPPVD